MHRTWEGSAASRQEFMKMIKQKVTFVLSAHINAAPYDNDCQFKVRPSYELENLLRVLISPPAVQILICLHSKQKLSSRPGSQAAECPSNRNESNPRPLERLSSPRSPAIGLISGINFARA